MSVILNLLKIISRAICVCFRGMSVFPYILCPVFGIVNKRLSTPSVLFGVLFLAFFYFYLNALERFGSKRLRAVRRVHTVKGWAKPIHFSLDSRGRADSLFRQAEKNGRY